MAKIPEKTKVEKAGIFVTQYIEFFRAFYPLVNQQIKNIPSNSSSLSLSLKPNLSKILFQRKHLFLLPWLVKEGVLVVFLSILSLIIFGFILFMTTDMTFRRLSIKEYDGSYLFFTIISYTLVLLIAEGKLRKYLLSKSDVLLLPLMLNEYNKCVTIKFLFIKQCYQYASGWKSITYMIR